jgi:hypothetical protein
VQLEQTHTLTADIFCLSRPGRCSGTEAPVAAACRHCREQYCTGSAIAHLAGNSCFRAAIDYLLPQAITGIATGSTTTVQHGTARSAIIKWEQSFPLLAYAAIAASRR